MAKATIRHWLWFAALWAGGVAACGLIALLLRGIMHGI